MKAMAIEQFGPLDGLKAADLPRPRTARGEVLVRVVAAGVNPVDWKICAGQLADVWPHKFPLIPGWDVAGVVEELGEATSRFRKGDRVWAYARGETVQWGCYAEYTAVEEAQAALMPSRLLFEEAAAVPVAALTAWQGLRCRPGLGPESKVLVLGAAGGVGHFAVQLARHAGASVYGTAGAEKQAFVASLGATATIDYARHDVVEEMARLCPDGVDLLLDTVGGEGAESRPAMVRPGGTIVGVAAPPDAEAAKERGVHAEFVAALPDGETLSTLAGMVDRKEIQPHVQQIFPLADAPEALRLSRDGHVQGKLVLAL
jgi:NADPH2:quinone reductase